jgi:hypothetical protein
MRTILILALVVGLLAALGIVQFKKRGDRVNVSIDTGRLEDKTEDFIDAVKDRISDDEPMHDRDPSLVEDAFERFEDRVERARDVVDDVGDDVEDRVRDARRRIDN